MNKTSLIRSLTRRFNPNGAALLLILAAPVLWLGTAVAEPLHPSAADSRLVRENWLARMRQAGLHGDRSQIPNMVAAFQNPPGIQYAEEIRFSLLHPLALLGATEALPALDEVIQEASTKPLPGQQVGDRYELEEVGTLSKAVRARIIAQNSAQGITDNQARASAEVQRFFQELGETPESLNAAVSAYEVNDRQHLEATKLISEQRHLNAPVELYALRELADMAYHDLYQGFAALPKVAKVDFTQDDEAALKIRLAPLSREQRIKALVEELGQEEMEDRHALRRAQLLADEGPAARLAIAAKQQDVKDHRERYLGKFGLVRGGTSALDKAQAQIDTAEAAAQRPLSHNATPNADLIKFPRLRQLAPGY